MNSMAQPRTTGHAVNAVRSICVDCATDCTPCTGQRGCRHAGRWEHYMVTAEVWATAGMPPHQIKPYGETNGDFLCVGCLEARLGRRLTPVDFTKCMLNEPSPWDTPRLAERKARKTMRTGHLPQK